MIKNINLQKLNLIGDNQNKIELKNFRVSKFETYLTRSKQTPGYKFTIVFELLYELHKKRILS